MRKGGDPKGDRLMAFAKEISDDEQKKLDKSRNGLKKLGLDASSLIITSITKEQGALPWKDFNLFWTLVQYVPEQSSKGLLQLLQSLSKAVSDGKSLEAANADSIINTISFCTFFTPFNTSDSAIASFLKSWAEKANYPAANEVVRRLVQFCGPGDMIGPLMIGCSTLHSAKEFSKLSDPLAFPTMDESDISGGDAVFLYPYLRHLAARDGKLSPLLSEALNKMLTLPQQLRINPKLAETTLLSLLHILKNLLAVAPTTDVTFLKRALTTMQQFYLWPCPYSLVTRDVLTVLRAESLSPGATMRQRLIEDSRNAEYAEEGKDGERRSGIYYFVDADDNTTSNLMAMMDVEAYKHRTRMASRRADTRTMGAINLAAAASAGLAPHTQALMLMSMIHCDAPLTEEEAEMFRQLTAEDVSRLYAKALAITPTNKDPDLWKDSRVRAFRDLKNEVKTVAANSKGKVCVRLPEELTPPYTPPLPEPRHTAVAASISKFPYTMVARDQLGLLCLKSMPYPETPFQDELEQLLKRFALPVVRESTAVTGLGTTEAHKSEGRVTALNYNGSEQDVRIVVGGGDACLHSFLSAYMNILQNKPEQLNGLRCMFYIVPFLENKLAAWLARYDGWYNRHVYVPFRSNNFVMPFVKGEPKKKDREDSIFPEPPGSLLKSLIDNYVREANVTVNLAVYKIQCWQLIEMKGGKTLKGKPEELKEEKDGPCDQLIPFVQQVEVGLAAAIAQWRDKYEKKGGPMKKDEDIMKDKTFDYMAPELTMSFAKMDLAGDKQKVVIDDPIPMQSIIVSSVPRKGDPCFPPDPTKKELEMHCRPARTYQNRTSRKIPILSDPQQHIHAVTLKAAIPGTGFSILVDGQRFGPFTKIKISPVHDLAGRRFYFPVQTYFPLDT